MTKQPQQPLHKLVHRIVTESANAPAPIHLAADVAIIAALTGLAGVILFVGVVAVVAIIVALA